MTPINVSRGVLLDPSIPIFKAISNPTSKFTKQIYPSASTMHLKFIFLGVAALFASASAAPSAAANCGFVGRYGAQRIGCKICPNGLKFYPFYDNCRLDHQCCDGQCCTQ